MYERLLVPLDGSLVAGIVLPYVVEIAARFNSEIVLVSVSESKAPDVDYLYRSYLEHVSEETRSRLRLFQVEESEAAVHEHVLRGHPPSEILRYADEVDAGLIIIASRGAASGGPWLLGDVAAKILRASTRPVLLVRTPARAEVIQQRSLIKKILVPLDGSRIGEAALPAAEAMAKPLGAELVLFQSVEAVFQAAPYNVAFPRQTPDERVQGEAHAYLNGVSKLLREHGLVVSTVVETGPAPERIIDYAKANAIDVIAMSTHGRSGIGRWVFGSVTDKVLHAGDTAVLVVRAVQPARGR
ncbi:MAG: universal stress protein [Chloroflexi bacterium]|nr:universal stress protein [Chloroflexota bacterium]